MRFSSFSLRLGSGTDDISLEGGGLYNRAGVWKCFCALVGSVLSFLSGALSADLAKNGEEDDSKNRTRDT